MAPSQPPPLPVPVGIGTGRMEALAKSKEETDNQPAPLTLLHDLGGAVDIDKAIARLLDGGRLEAPELRQATPPMPAFTPLQVCHKAIELLAREGNVQPVQCPVGDVHGQLYDVFEMFRVAGWPPDTNYLFLGDYVDRGYYSAETISLLLCYKVRHPTRITLIRGNHETREVTKTYGFWSECLKKYDTHEVYSDIMSVFDHLPLSALIDGQVLGLHGCLTPLLRDLDQARIVDRFHEPEHDTLLNDVLWSDPDSNKQGFIVSARGTGWHCGADVCRAFNYHNGLDTVLRAHQMCDKGYDFLFDGAMITVWSAPNYCYRCGNLASVLEIPEVGMDNFHFNVFDRAPDSERKVPEEGQGAGDFFL